MESAALSVQVEPARRGENLVETFVTRQSNVRHALYRILEICETPRTSGEVDESTALLIPRGSVYTSAVLREWLERVGGLERTIQAAPSEGVSLSADGMTAERECTVQATPVGTCGSVEGNDTRGCVHTDEDSEITGSTLWRTTPAGLGAVASLAPSKLLRSLLEGSEERYVHIYLAVLAFCDEAPRSKSDIEDLIGDHPDLQNPRRYASYFVNRLGEVGAIEWNGMWSTTESGRTAIQR